MANQIAHLFSEIPDNLEDFILASQITQAEAKKFFIEFWRMRKGQRSGILWWNLRDGWPIISDAVVDYYDRKKLAYWFIKQVQTNICVMIGEAEDARHPLIVVNDTRQAVTGQVSVCDVDSDTSLLEVQYEVAANGKTVIGQLESVSEPGMWLIEWEVGEYGRCYNHYLAGSPPVSLDDYRRWLPQMKLLPG